MQITKTIMSLSALCALASGTVKAQSFAQAFEQRMAAQAAIDYNFEQHLRQSFGLPNGKGMVLVTSHSISITGEYGKYWPLNLNYQAKLIATEGLLRNPESEYFEATISDSHGQGRAFLQRSDLNAPAGHHELESPTR